MSDPDFVRAADPEEAFSALADETRVEIFRALWETVEFSCSDCDHLMSMGVPPGVLDGLDAQAVPDVA
ncbi:MAG: hypothetical protein V5A43_10970 [Haloarculaceae archaeon]